jgi:uncharacterized protein (DUF58 family)
MPLILENSPDARMLIPMAIALAYGILFGTVFILIILPVLLLLNNKLSVFLNKLRRIEITNEESLEPAVINAGIEKTLNENMAKSFD